MSENRIVTSESELMQLQHAQSLPLNTLIVEGIQQMFTVKTNTLIGKHVLLYNVDLEPTSPNAYVYFLTLSGIAQKNASFITRQTFPNLQTVYLHEGDIILYCQLKDNVQVQRCAFSEWIAQNKLLLDPSKFSTPGDKQKIRNFAQKCLNIELDQIAEQEIIPSNNKYPQRSEYQRQRSQYSSQYKSNDNYQPQQQQQYNDQYQYQPRSPTQAFVPPKQPFKYEPVMPAYSKTLNSQTQISQPMNNRSPNNITKSQNPALMSNYQSRPQPQLSPQTKHEQEVAIASRLADEYEKLHKSPDFMNLVNQASVQADIQKGSPLKLSSVVRSASNERPVGYQSYQQQIPNSSVQRSNSLNQGRSQIGQAQLSSSPVIKQDNYQIQKPTKRQLWTSQEPEAQNLDHDGQNSRGSGSGMDNSYGRYQQQYSPHALAEMELRERRNQEQYQQNQYQNQYQYQSQQMRSSQNRNDMYNSQRYENQFYSSQRTENQFYTSQQQNQQQYNQARNNIVNQTDFVMQQAEQTYNQVNAFYQKEKNHQEFVKTSPKSVYFQYNQGRTSRDLSLSESEKQMNNSVENDKNMPNNVQNTIKQSVETERREVKSEQKVGDLDKKDLKVEEKNGESEQILQISGAKEKQDQQINDLQKKLLEAEEKKAEQSIELEECRKQILEMRQEIEKKSKQDEDKKKLYEEFYKLKAFVQMKMNEINEEMIKMANVFEGK